MIYFYFVLILPILVKTQPHIVSFESAPSKINQDTLIYITAQLNQSVSLNCSENYDCLRYWGAQICGLCLTLDIVCYDSNPMSDGDGDSFTSTAYWDGSRQSYDSDYNMIMSPYLYFKLRFTSQIDEVQCTLNVIDIGGEASSEILLLHQSNNSVTLVDYSDIPISSVVLSLVYDDQNVDPPEIEYDYEPEIVYYVITDFPMTATFTVSYLANVSVVKRNYYGNAVAVLLETSINNEFILVDVQQYVNPIQQIQTDLIFSAKIDAATDTYSDYNPLVLYQISGFQQFSGVSGQLASVDLSVVDEYEYLDPYNGSVYIPPFVFAIPDKTKAPEILKAYTDSRVHTVGVGKFYVFVDLSGGEFVPYNLEAQDQQAIFSFNVKCGKIMLPAVFDYGYFEAISNINQNFGLYEGSILPFAVSTNNLPPETQCEVRIPKNSSLVLYSTNNCLLGPSNIDDPSNINISACVHFKNQTLTLPLYLPDKNSLFVTIDTSPPRVLSMSIPIPGQALSTDLQQNSILITVTFSANMNIHPVGNVTPVILMVTGNNATLVNYNANVATFLYITQIGEVTPPGKWFDVSNPYAINFFGWVVQDAALSTAANLTVPVNLLKASNLTFVSTKTPPFPPLAYKNAACQNIWNVTLKILVNSFFAVSESQQTFNMDFEANFSWVDPGFQVVTSPQNVLSSVLAGKVYSPDLVWQNIRSSLSPVGDQRILFDPNTQVVTQLARYIGLFTWNINAADFPFDFQIFPINVSVGYGNTRNCTLFLPYDYSNDPVVDSARLIPNPTYSITDIYAASQVINDPLTGTQSGFISTNILVRRNSSLQTLMTLLPLSLTMFACYFTFWTSLKQDARISVPSASLVAVLAFSNTLLGVLPPVQYITRTSLYLILTIVYILIVFFAQVFIRYTYATCEDVEKKTGVAEKLKEKYEKEAKEGAKDKKDKGGEDDKGKEKEEPKPKAVKKPLEDPIAKVKVDWAWFIIVTPYNYEMYMRKLERINFYLRAVYLLIFLVFLIPVFLLPSTIPEIPGRPQSYITESFAIWSWVFIFLIFFVGVLISLTTFIIGKCCKITPKNPNLLEDNKYHSMQDSVLIIPK